MDVSIHVLKDEQESSGETRYGMSLQGKASVPEAEVNKNKRCWGAPGALVSIEYTGEEMESGKPGEME